MATILAVDDSPINLATIEQKLKDSYEVIPVNSGFRALQYLKSEKKPDLILLDIRMAEKDGIETLKEIREMGLGDIPVIMLTSQNDKGTIVESQKLGIYDYVLKPFDTADLHDRIRRALQKAKDDSNH